MSPRIFFNPLERNENPRAEEIVHRFLKPSTISKRSFSIRDSRARELTRRNVEDRSFVRPRGSARNTNNNKVRFTLWNIVTRRGSCDRRLLSSECKQCNESYERFPFTIPQHHCAYRFPFTIGASGHADEKRPRKLIPRYINLTRVV